MKQYKIMKNEAVSTFDKFMADPKQKELFDKEYSIFCASESNYTAERDSLLQEITLNEIIGEVRELDSQKR